MKTLSTAVQNVIAKKLGIEPFLILEIKWNKSGSYFYYTDKATLETSGFGKILQVGNIEASVKLDYQGQTQSLNVTLDDTDGVLKQIIDSVDIHNAECNVYQCFAELAINEKFLLFQGNIVSPIEWNEGDRTLSVSIITKTNDAEVGFAPEETYFPHLPDSIVGKAWPLCFGTVQNVPAVRLDDIPDGQLGTGLGRTDPSLSRQLNYIQLTREDLFNFFLLYWYGALSVEPSDPRRQQYVDQANEYLAAYQLYGQDAATLSSRLSQQNNTAKGSISILNGNKYPQGVTLTLKIGDTSYTGTFSGDVFTIDTLDVEDYDGSFDEPYGYKYNDVANKVQITSNLYLKHIVNIVDSEVLNVKVKANGELQTLNPRYYTVEKIEADPFTFVVVNLNRIPSSINENFENDLYVTLESTVGPNTVDILEWAIETYTDYTIDSVSFNHVKSLIENYPSHFALLNKKNIITFLEEVAFQARCSLWVVNNKIYIKYLPEDAVAVKTFTNSNVMSNSLIIRSSDTEEIYTKLTAKWTDNYAIESYYTSITLNTTKYGVKEKQIDMYIYNLPELVVKSMMFWIIRFANCWKKVRLNCFLDNLDAEVYDTVQLNLSSINSKGFIEQITYDSDKKLLDILVHSYTRLGENSDYIYTTPKDLSIDIRYPLTEQIQKNEVGSSVTNVDGRDFINDKRTRESYYNKNKNANNIRNYNPYYKALEYIQANIPVYYPQGRNGAPEQFGEGFQPDPEYFNYLIEDLEYTYEEARSKYLEGIYTNDYKEYLREKKGLDATGIAQYYAAKENPSLPPRPPLGDVETGAREPFFKNLVPEDEPTIDPYEYKTYTPENKFKATDGVYPAKVIEKVANTIYRVELYMAGLNNTPAIVEVEQLQIDTDAEIPSGSWTLVNVKIVDGVYEYTMQIPVWL